MRESLRLVSMRNVRGNFSPLFVFGPLSPCAIGNSRQLWRSTFAYRLAKLVIVREVQRRWW